MHWMVASRFYPSFSSQFFSYAYLLYISVFLLHVHVADPYFFLNFVSFIFFFISWTRTIWTTHIFRRTQTHILINCSSIPLAIFSHFCWSCHSILHYLNGRYLSVCSEDEKKKLEAHATWTSKWYTYKQIVCNGNTNKKVACKNI